MLCNFLFFLLIITSSTTTFLSNAAAKRPKPANSQLCMQLAALAAFNDDCSSTGSESDIDEKDYDDQPTEPSARELLKQVCKSNDFKSVKAILETNPELNDKALKRTMLHAGAHECFLAAMDLLSDEQLLSGAIPEENPLGRIKVLARLLKNCAMPARQESALNCLHKLLTTKPIVAKMNWNDVIKHVKEIGTHPISVNILLRIQEILRSHGVVINDLVDTTGSSSSTTTSS